MAAEKAAPVFSVTPFDASCRPRWAIGRAVSHSKRAIGESGNLEKAFDLHCSICGQGGDADRCARMPAFVAEYLYHQVRGAIHHLRPVGETGCRIDETTQPHDTHYFVEITKCTFELRKQVDRACARRLLSVLDGYAGP